MTMSLLYRSCGLFLILLSTNIALTSSFTTTTRNLPFLKPTTLSRQQQHLTLPHTTTSLSSSTNDDGTPKNAYDYALIFDCDGVIIETEELHRLAYNAAFKHFDLTIDSQPVEWSTSYYDILQNTVGGGKNKMFFHFRNTTKAFPSSTISSTPPTTPEEQQKLIDDLQDKKTLLYKDMITTNAVPRPGVLELMDEALAEPSIAVGVCSASTKEAVTAVLDVTLGEERRKKLNVCILGNDVERLKPDPMIYDTAAERLGMTGERKKRCVVVEDSLVGLKAAKGAGMRCLITYTSSTEREDFYGYGCDAKVPDLKSRSVTLESIFGPLRENLDAEILVDAKDPVESVVV